MTGEKTGLAALAESLLFGTEHGPPALPAAGGDLGRALDAGARTADDGESAALVAAAVLAPYAEAGRLPADAESLPQPEPSPAEERPPCSGGPADLLRRLLDERPELVAEWLALAGRRGVRAPVPLLPRLLELGQRDPEVRERLAPVAGRRGTWLARHNPDWAWAAVSEEPDADGDSVWEEGALAERRAFLEAGRRRDPAAGRALLEEIWPSENAATRSALLKCFEEGLGSDDEPWLESCLDDRSKQVRETAAELLGRLPESRRAKRMVERCRAIVRVERKLLRTRLLVEPPAALDDAMRRDGLSDKKGQGGGRLGAAAWRLWQLVAATPTSFWTEELGLAPDQLVKLVDGHTWEEALREGLAEAAIHCRDGELALALVRRGADTSKGTSDEAALLRAVPSKEREAYLAERLARASGPGAVLNAFGWCEACTDDVWGEELSKAAVAVLLRQFGKARAGQNWQLGHVLPHVARRLAATVLGDARARWPKVNDPTPSLEDKLDDFVIVLDLRTRMHQELAP